jgi:C4-type Zn-finger protein
MTSPIEEITVECPKCGHHYEDWFRASVNLDLDPFDAEYLESCSTATCPECQHKVNLDVLLVEDGVFKLGSPE